MHKTIIAHFYNEEYLLPFWLNHHKQFFDHGILVNYASTDKSCEIIKELCPSWEIRDSKNNFFSATACDLEIAEIEREITDWRICLNITEFLIGDFTKLSNFSGPLLIPQFLMVDTLEQMYSPINSNIPLLKQRQYGVNITTKKQDPVHDRFCRNFSEVYIPSPTTGRHWRCEHNTDLFRICWYRFSPFNEEMIKRNLQIQTRIPESDKISNLGFEHVTSKEKLLSDLKIYQQNSTNLQIEINKLYV